ncbi:lantibiotic dehydratase [Bowmanella dokdonensis]|uniref:Lantibiotic dehydratase n=1 Tax=Bowmanella dokdonensis TaxID=751969 RepID=A0A939IPZ1_9ALTE|nr:lantibiotic dehydratase [Bowmanella dokdonensis]MBN7823936.1 lantibiotic dehydratase [Bowmanella dokdonensis]
MSTKAHTSNPGLRLKNLLVHPNYILRVGGESIHSIEHLESGQTISLLQERDRLLSTLDREITLVCDALEERIPDLQEKSHSRAAINIKRALFNRKLFKADWLSTLQDCLPGELNERIRHILQHLEKAQVLTEQAIAAYDQEIDASGPGIRALLAHDNLLDGLAYSNPDLKAKLLRGLGDPSRKLKQKELRNQEDALLQYYARCSTKTSPLSTFTVAHVGQWQQGSEQPGWQIDFSDALERRVEFKAGLIHYLLAPLVERFEYAAALFPFKLNTSVRRADGKIRLMSVSAGQEGNGRTWGTGLSESSLNENAVIGLIEHVLNAAPDGHLYLQPLCEQVCRLAPKLNAGQVMQFVGRLFAIKYLLPETGDLQQQDHLEWGIALCEKADARLGMALTAPLKQIRQQLTLLAAPSCAQREDKINSIRDAVGELAETLGVDKDSPIFRPTFYENCYLQQRDRDLDVSVLSPFYEELSRLQGISFLLDFNQEVRAYMTDLFLSQYTEQGICTDVRGFLEQFDEIYSPGVIGGQIDKSRQPASSDLNRQMMEVKQAFDDYLAPLLQGSENVELSIEALDGILAQLPDAVKARSSSYSYAVQVAGQSGQGKMILNQVFGGRSSIMSRFMEILDAEQIDALKSYLKNSSEHQRYMELSGVFGFNANRHPRLCDTELVVPPFPVGRQDTSKLRLDELSLVFDRDKHTLVFQDPQGNKLDLWYQGLLIPSLLPRFHRLLSLGFTDGPSLTVIKSLIERNLISASSPCVVPRVSLGNLVMFRRSWIMPFSHVPDPNVSAKDFYFAIQAWKQARNLPTRFFLRALPLVEDAEGQPITNAVDWDNVNFKDMKPFYVDLDSPRFTRLMQRMLKRNRFTLCLSELLPDLKDYASTVEGRPHVSELHFELSAPARQPLVQQPSWHLMRVAYFEQSKADLILGPVAQAIEMARATPGVWDVLMQPHWKFGPHVDLRILTDQSTFQNHLYPALKGLFDTWLAEHPSKTVLEPAEYEALSRKIGMFELESGPYLPLLENNSVSLAPFKPSQNLLLQEYADSKDRMMADFTPDLIRLLGAKQAQADAFFLTLVGMLVITGNSFAMDGIQRGYMSLRSHADYFFSAHDSKGQLQAKFNAMEQGKRRQLDEIVTHCTSRRFRQIPLPAEFLSILEHWQQVVDAMSLRHEQIVRDNYDLLVSQTTHQDTANSLKDALPEEFIQAFSNKKTTELGEYFLNTEEGQQAQKSQMFMVYRTNVNFFYSLLPILEASPIQKFCLCHLVANSVERVFDKDWRSMIGLTRELSA